MARSPRRRSAHPPRSRRLPPLVALLRGAAHQCRLELLGRFGHRRLVQRRSVERSLAALDRWYAPAVDPAAALHAAERSRWSQNGEDGLLAELVRRVGAPTQTFVEIGSADGAENCTRALAEDGWKGVWLEADAARARRARVLTSRLDVDVRQAMVTSANVRALLSEAGVSAEPDVAVLDIDGSDLWVLRALLRGYAPRILVVEYNASFTPGMFWTCRNRASYEWDETYRHGASLDAMTWAAGRHGYELAACDRAGVNAFFVRGDLAADAGVGGHPLAELYRPLVIAPPAIGHPWRVDEPCPPLTEEERSAVCLASASLAFRRGSQGGCGEQLVGVRVAVDNATGKRLTSAGANPLLVSARILDEAGAVIDPEGDRSWLYGGVQPRRRAWGAALFRIRDPRAHTLRVCLVQEGVAWLEHGAVDVPIR